MKGDTFSMPGTGYSNPTDITETSQVNRELEILADALKEFANIIVGLEKRLGGVLLNEPSKSSGRNSEVGVPIQGLVPIAAIIKDRRREVEIGIEAVRDILSRLEL